MNYKKVYDSIIENAKSLDRQKKKGTYYEAHHIVPKCLGGDGNYRDWHWHPNIVLLTYKEHYICHKLLCRIYPNNRKILFALVAMGQINNRSKRYKLSARGYQEIKELRSRLSTS
jgi:hypothetical protein